MGKWGDRPARSGAGGVVLLRGVGGGLFRGGCCFGMGWGVVGGAIMRGGDCSGGEGKGKGQRLRLEVTLKAKGKG